MANTSCIFKGSYSFLLTAGGLKLENGQKLGIGLSPTADLHVYNASNTIKAILREGPAQTAKIQEWRDASDNVIASMGYSGTSNHAVLELSGNSYSYYRMSRGAITASAGGEYRTGATANWFIGTIENSNRFRWFSYGITAPVMELGYDAADCRLIVRGGAGQTGCLQQWEDVSSNVMAKLGPAGEAKFTGLLLGSRIINFSTTLATNDYTALIDASSGNITITLPAVAGEVGRVYVIKKTDSTANSVIIDGNGSETIDGQLTQTITTQYAFIKIQSNGIGWHIIG